jgi:hypothetical protein
VKPWLKQEWCFPKLGAEFVWRMEDLCDLYAEPPDPRRPLVCVDERPYQLVGEVIPSQLPTPDQPARFDYEYERKGTANLFVAFSPTEAWRQVEPTERRTAVDFAFFMRALIDEHFSESEVIRLVVDNLNTHTPASFYKAFPPEEARRLVSKLEWHYTPEHGSWLNQVEIEISVLSRQCLEGRIPDAQTLRREVKAWETARNAAGATIDWRFTTKNARTKLKRLYPDHS